MLTNHVSVKRVKLMFYIVIAVFLFTAEALSVLAEESLVKVDSPGEFVDLDRDGQKEFFRIRARVENGTASGRVIIGVNRYKIESGAIGCKFNGGCVELEATLISDDDSSQQPDEIRSFAMKVKPQSEFPEDLAYVLTDTVVIEFDALGQVTFPEGSPTDW